MTDAERIAEYLKKVELDDGPIEDIERMCRYRGEVLPSSRYGVTMALRDMLSDVRREERDACRRDVELELDGAKHRRTTSLRVGGNVIHVQLADAQIDALGWAIKRIKVRGIE